MWNTHEYTDLMFRAPKLFNKIEKIRCRLAARNAAHYRDALDLTCDHPLFFLLGLVVSIEHVLPAASTPGPEGRGLTNTVQNCNNGSEFEKCLCRPSLVLTRT
jgi:hypothetical protein